MPPRIPKKKMIGPPIKELPPVTREVIFGISLQINSSCVCRPVLTDPSELMNHFENYKEFYTEPWKEVEPKGRKEIEIIEPPRPWYLAPPGFPVIIDGARVFYPKRPLVCPTLTKTLMSPIGPRIVALMKKKYGNGLWHAMKSEARGEVFHVLNSSVGNYFLDKLADKKFGDQLASRLVSPIGKKLTMGFLSADSLEDYCESILAMRRLVSHEISPQPRPALKLVMPNPNRTIEMLTRNSARVDKVIHGSSESKEKKKANQQVGSGTKKEPSQPGEESKGIFVKNEPEGGQRVKKESGSDESSSWWYLYPKDEPEDGPTTSKRVKEESGSDKSSSCGYLYPKDEPEDGPTTSKRTIKEENEPEGGPTTSKRVKKESGSDKSSSCWYLYPKDEPEDGPTTSKRTIKEENEPEGGPSASKRVKKESGSYKSSSCGSSSDD